MNKILSIFLAIIVTSCASHYISSRKLNRIELGMTKETLALNIGQGIRRGSMVNKFGQQLEVWEYRVDMGRDPGQIAQSIALSLARIPVYHQSTYESYWLFFLNGKLVQWNRAGDWQDAQKQIYDINFNVNKG